jgi:hypothetical protein
VRQRRLRRAGQVLLVLLLVGAFASTGGSAQAEAPVAQGWWTTTNVKDQLPVDPPALPVQVPPDVPPDGLLVQGGLTEDAPSAYAALVYDLDEGLAPGKLTLKLAPASASSPASTLRLCKLADSSLSPEQGGAMDHAPKYDCGGAATATANSDNTSYTFDAGKLADGGVLAVAILPSMATDRVVLDRPGSSSLTTTTATTTTTSGSSAPPAFEDPAAAPAAGGTGTAETPALQSGATAQVPALPTADVPGPAVAEPAAQPAVAASQQPVALAPAAASSPAGHGTRTALLLVAALAVAAVLWSTAGNSAVAAGSALPEGEAHA